jgi:hypothetical protein
MAFSYVLLSGIKVPNGCVGTIALSSTALSKTSKYIRLTIPAGNTRADAVYTAYNVDTSGELTSTSYYASITITKSGTITTGEFMNKSENTTYASVDAGWMHAEGTAGSYLQGTINQVLESSGNPAVNFRLQLAAAVYARLSTQSLVASESAYTWTVRAQTTGAGTLVIERSTDNAVWTIWKSSAFNYHSK